MFLASSAQLMPERGQDFLRADLLADVDGETFQYSNSLEKVVFKIPIPYLFLEHHMVTTFLVPLPKILFIISSKASHQKLCFLTTSVPGLYQPPAVNSGSGKHPHLQKRLDDAWKMNISHF